MSDRNTEKNNEPKRGDSDNAVTCECRGDTLGVSDIVPIITTS